MNPRDILHKIGKEIPKDLLKKGIVKEKPFAFEREIIEQRARDPKISYQEREMLKKSLESKRLNETWNRETTSINPKVSEEISRRVDAQVKREIASGRLKPADKKDSFFNFLGKHMKR